MSLTLFSYYRSSCSYRVRIALNLKKLEYQINTVHLVQDGGQQNRAEYVALNSMRHVPTLVHDDRVIAESVAIIEYLDHRYDQPKLIPKDPYQAAKVRQLVEIVNSGIQPLQNLKVMQYVESQLGGDKLAFARHWIEQGLDALEATMKPLAGEYSLANSLSAADCYLIPQLYNARRLGIDTSVFATLNRVDQNCRSQSSFQKAHPSQQPDTPDELRHENL